MKFTYLILFLVLGSILFCSCKDESTIDMMQGRWYTDADLCGCDGQSLCEYLTYIEITDNTICYKFIDEPLDNRDCHEFNLNAPESQGHFTLIHVDKNIISLDIHYFATPSGCIRYTASK